MRYLKWMGVLSLVLISRAFSLDLPENHAINGGVTIIPVDFKQKPDVFYEQHRIAVVPSENPNQWLLIVGIPSESTKAIQELLVNTPKKGNIPFHISHKSYKTQSLTIKDPRKVIPLPEDQERIDAETKQLNAIYSTFTMKNPFISRFQAPAKAPISSQFGLNRVYNKMQRPPHLGLDIAAPENTVVSSIGSGKVIEAGDYFYTGNTVIIDHGMGVFSLYGHLKQIDVKKDDNVEKGQPIGTVGMTGRATGPHLHWGMVINQVYVDPLLFIPAAEIAAPAPAAPKKTASTKS